MSGRSAMVSRKFANACSLGHDIDSGGRGFICPFMAATGALVPASGDGQSYSWGR
ncbi:MAG TPA: hypothetical protein VI756_07315 [Blastocatellia bacterium]